MVLMRSSCLSILRCRLEIFRFTFAAVFMTLLFSIALIDFAPVEESHSSGTGGD